ncbi:unnamed protein product [Rhodiola kirilowii]
MYLAHSMSPLGSVGSTVAMKCRSELLGSRVLTGGRGRDDPVGVGLEDGSFPGFLPKEVLKIKDPFARRLAQRMERLPVESEYHDRCIMSSCVKPLVQREEAKPVVLLHSFDSSLLEWRCAYPLLEGAGLEAWAVDILGWGFSDLEKLPPCDAESKRHHLYQFWKSYVKRPMTLVGPSLGASLAIDFAVNFPEAVDRLVLINPSVYAEGTKHMKKMPRIVAYAGVSLLGCIPLRLFANQLAFNSISFNTNLDWTNVGRLHCLLPWWKDATVDFMFSGGFNVIQNIKKVKQKVLIIGGENDQIVSNKLVHRLHSELADSKFRQVSDSGHLPHVEKAKQVSQLITEFAFKE